MILQYEQNKMAATNTIQQELRKTMVEMAEDLRKDSSIFLKTNEGSAVAKSGAAKADLGAVVSNRAHASL